MFTIAVSFKHYFMNAYKPNFPVVNKSHIYELVNHS